MSEKGTAGRISTLLSHVSARPLTSIGDFAAGRRRGLALAMLALAVVAALGAWASASLTRRMKSTVRDELVTIRDAEREALLLWAEDNMRVAETHARDPRVREALLAVAAAPASEVGPDLPAYERAASLLRPVAERHGYHSIAVVRRDGIAVSGLDPRVRVEVRLSGLPSVQRSFEGERGMSRPVRPGDFVVTPTEETAAIPPRIYFSAPVWSAEGQVAAVLVLTSDPAAHFSRILRIARAGNTGETYAFDAQGTMLSESRFLGDLKRLGLVPDEEDASTVRVVEIRDPGGDLVDGYVPMGARTEMPLTRMARAATQGRSGYDVDGYRDYRGVPVVGAWTWIPQLAMGLATEMDQAEAFASLIFLQRGFWGLVVLLAVAILGLIAYGVVVARLEKTVERAQRLGQYEVGKKIGEGGMGSVYEAEHALLKRPTALKLLDGAEATPDRIARFEREVRATAGLSHPNTIAVFDFGHTADGTFYYAMELLDGVSLEQLVRDEGPLPPERVVHVLRQVAGSLAEAHDRGLVHRDIKPANIMLTERGGIADFVKVLDFGLVTAGGDAAEQSKLTKADALTGTPMYMAPEQIVAPDEVDARSDLYQLGAVAYFLLTATEPFQGKSVVEILHHHVQSEPEPPSARVQGGVPEGLERLVLDLMAKEKDARPASADDLLDRLDACGVGPWTRDDAERSWRRAASLPAPRPSPSSAPDRSAEAFAKTQLGE